MLIWADRSETDSEPLDIKRKWGKHNLMMNKHVVSFLFVNVDFETCVLFLLFYGDMYDFSCNNKRIGFLDVKVLLFVVWKFLDDLSMTKNDTIG
jgi:hypothetical protein